METKSFKPKVPRRVWVGAVVLDVVGMLAGLMLMLTMPDSGWLYGVFLIMITAALSATMVIRSYLRAPCPDCGGVLERNDEKLICEACDVHWQRNH